MTAGSSRRRLVLLGAGALTALEAVVVARRRGRLLALDTVVRCRRGHCFTTWWVPGASLKALRLGWWRWQRCPVGRHWTLVTPVDPRRLDPAEREVAACWHDRRLP
ncbi:hypothetical protein ACFFRE_04245 [Aciditerrimonas ferrireducens]|uniref:Toxin CptA n=1 Tax=Aciditerrimonas ferrireducens TaxID=667306 RepID=A0ABV6C105_9ACTN